MPDSEKRLQRIEDKLDSLLETNFTKDDMEQFKRDICSPSRECQGKQEFRIQKIEKFQARLNGMFVAVATIWGMLIAILGIKHGR